MIDHKRKTVSYQVKTAKNRFINFSDKLENIFSTDLIQNILNESTQIFRNRIFTLPLTLFTFVKQVLQEDISCQNIVNQVLSERLAAGESKCSSNTASYSEARKRLPESLVHALVLETGKSCENSSINDWKWHGREVKIADGTILSMPDTPANRREYPQSGNQKEGCGFPLIRLVCLFSLSTGAVINYATAPYKGKETGETALLREQFNSLNKGDILMADRYYPSFFYSVIY